MSESKEILVIQNELFSRLLKTERNFRKSPKERLAQRQYIETRLQGLEDLWADFKAGHRKLIAQVPDEDKQRLKYFDDDLYESFEENYIMYRTTLTASLSAMQKVDSTPKTREREHHKEANVEVKLPRIQIPTFSGKYEEWQSFYDMFVSLIHENKTLADVQKLHYLKTSLSGEPEKLLRNFATTEQNYDEAWKQLKKRYDNKRYNVNTVMKTLFSQKPINESANSVKQLLDTTTSCLKALENMGVLKQGYDVFVVYIVVSRLDMESHKQWEQILCLSDELPSWAQLVEFLEARFRSLEMLDTGNQMVKYSTPYKARPMEKPKSFHSSVQDNRKTQDVNCVLCNGEHYLYHCTTFEQKPIKDRADFVQMKGLCFNCMSPTHVAQRCRQSSCCRKCGRRHHTMLHFDKEPMLNDNNGEGGHTQPIKGETEKHSSKTTDMTKVVVNFAKGELQSYNVLLATAIIKASADNGKKYVIRALLDQGSQASFVSETVVQLLGLKRVPINGVVSGLGDGQTRIKHMVSLRVEARHNPEITIQVNAYVLGNLTSMLPSHKLTASEWVELESLQLADPDYALPSNIDILLGAEVYSEIILSGMIKNPQGNLIAQSTAFGWVLSGRVSKNKDDAKNVISMHTQINEDDWLKQFWEIEAEPNSIKKKLTKEEIQCEEYYDKTTTRNKDGRFVVRLPFRSEDPECLHGKSKQIAEYKLKSLEKRLTKNPDLRKEYEKVMKEYLTLNHMVLVEDADINNPKAIYLPHHAVVREDKETTKVRVVMNASSPGSNGVSLNDDLLVGPKLQQDLRHLLMRWRTYPIGIIADLVKMYRQVLVHEEDTNFQRVLWRSSLDIPIQNYKLLTLTFGTACAPYLAVKTLQRLAQEETHNYPTAAVITQQDYYMDDLMTGCETEKEAVLIYEEMNKLMNAGGFEVQKWSSNNMNLLRYIGEDKNNSDKAVPIKGESMLKVLGVCWNRETDNFEYTVCLPKIKEPITKRQVLSDIARLYDPLGWIAPAVICGKMIIQDIWKAKLSWDDCLTEELCKKWLTFRRDLEDISGIKIPRWLNTKRDRKVELHAFSDASKVGYAGAVYLRSVDGNGKCHVSLVASKTKVAPIIKELSIPRLELCGAVLATKLLSEISQVMNIAKDNLFAWTDSTIVLAWLNGGASRWVTFVSNRVSEILSILDFEQWGHVSSETNPADCASRGLPSAELQNHSLWWNGPYWLAEQIIDNKKPDTLETHEEERVKTMTIVKRTENELEWTKFSKLNRMLRIISYCRRVIGWKRANQGNDRPSYIITSEIKDTLNLCIKQVQEIEFGFEMKQLKGGGSVLKKSVLLTLCPILDKDGILRVGGRIEQAHATYEKRHPIILPAKSHLTWLIIADAHERTLHGGPQIMLNYLRSKYWIIRAREQVKKFYRRCTTCLRYSKHTRTQIMGELPEVRLRPSKPFRSTGVDYAGPINIRFSPGRGSKSYKGYISLFVCMVTRAIHIEVVSDLTSKAFIAAFKRFTSRRGHCQDLYSDNGTNFVGADKQLREMFNRAKSAIPNEIVQALTLENTKWHFIPAHAPNFGGLWEAGVRSAKIHLKKVIGDSTLTYEELSTVLAQVESCLNSRPISILSDSPEDPLPLTPGHFLIGESIVNVADENLSDCKVIGLDRWKLTQKMVNDFWKRWSKEYLVGLNQRYKWTTKYSEPNNGDIVIVKEDNIPPCKWILGLIVQKHIGPDNLTRVVTVKTKQGTLKRPLSKVCVLTK